MTLNIKFLNYKIEAGGIQHNRSHKRIIAQ